MPNTRPYRNAASRTNRGTKMTTTAQQFTKDEAQQIVRGLEERIEWLEQSADFAIRSKKPDEMWAKMLADANSAYTKVVACSTLVATIGGSK